MHLIITIGAQFLKLSSEIPNSGFNQDIPEEKLLCQITCHFDY